MNAIECAKAARNQKFEGRLNWLRRLHRSHLPERGPFSICMHRSDAATVSYTVSNQGPGPASSRWRDAVYLSADAVLDAVLEIVPTGLRGDDVAVLAASLPPGEPAAARSASRWLTPLPLSVPLARSWVQGLLTAWSTSEATRHAAALVVSELVTNAFRNTDDLVRVSVSSDGPGPGVLVEVFDRSHRLPYLRDRGIEDTAGRGLYIVAELAADWGVRESLDGKTVWARIEELSR